MIYGNIGFRFETKINRPSASLIEEFKRYPTPNIADAMGRFRVMDPGLKPINSIDIACGPALTVMVRPGDNLMLHKALEIAEPGDVLVVNTFRSDNTAVWGGIMTRIAMKRGIAGLLVDGAIRDGEDMYELGFPAWARSVVGSGCDKDGPGEINFPVCCGGVVVNPGDIIVASREGIVVVPLNDAEYVLEQSKLVAAKETKLLDEIAQGNGLIFKGYVDSTLQNRKVTTKAD